MNRSGFVGVWRLVSWENHCGGEITHPLGRDVAGYLTYTPEGYMFVAIMASGRPRFSSEDSMGGTLEEKAAALDTFASYCGTYEAQEGRVVHHVEVCSFPNWEGTSQTRIFEMDGDRLKLSSLPQPLAGREQTAHLVWERVRGESRGGLG